MIFLVSKNDVFFKGQYKVEGGNFKNGFVRALQFHGALRERFCVFVCAWGSLEMAKPRVTGDYEGYLGFLMSLLSSRAVLEVFNGVSKF